MDSSIEMNCFAQHNEESLMEAWSRIKNINNNSVDRAISELQTYMEECPTKNEISNLIIHASSQFRNTKQKLSAISQKMEILVNCTCSNYALIKRLDIKVHSMINMVEIIPVDTTKEENDLKMPLEALIRKRNERKVEEVKNA
jgi:hypothetical protein